MEINEFEVVETIINAVKETKLKPIVEITDYSDYLQIKFKFYKPLKLKNGKEIKD